MKRRYKAVVAVAIAVVMAFAMVGCGGGNNSSQGGSKDTLKFGCYVYATSQDPAIEQNSAWDGMRWGVLEGLFKFDSNIEPQPNLAKGITSDDSHTVWTIEIKDGIKFSNGNACDAKAVANSLNRLYNVCSSGDPTYSSKPSSYMQVSSIEASADNKSVVIKTKKAYADISGTLCFPYYAIIDVDGDLTDANHKGGYGSKVVATGPYSVATFDKTTKNATLEKNTNYWDGEVPFSKVEIIFVEDDLSKSMALQKGDVDLTENIANAGEMKTLSDSGKYNISKVASLRTGLAWVNHAGVLGNKDLREAVFMAIDNQTICEKTVGGLYINGTGILPDTLGYNKTLKSAYTYNLEAAKKKLDDAGIKDTDNDGVRELNGKPISLNYVTYQNRALDQFAQAIQASLQQIGITCKVNSTDSSTNWNLMQSGEYDLLDQNWMTAPTGDALSFMDYWYSDGGKAYYSPSNPDGVNYCKYSNAEYDKLYEQAEASLDANTRANLITQMEQILIDDTAVVNHGYWSSSMISTQAITGADMSPVDYYWLSTKIKPASK